MKHSEYIVKIAASKAVHEAHARLQSWPLVVKECGLLTVLRAGAMNRFYQRHKDDPSKPEWGHLEHDDVCLLKSFTHLSTEETKALLAEKVGVHEMIRPYWPDGPSQATIRLLLKSVADWRENEDWFVQWQKKGIREESRHLVHWKHTKNLKTH